jgi:CRISPR-associated protein Cmr2
MSYLMVIGVGPVQEFIASARRSRDLWFGSWLLSEISKAAAKTIHEYEGGELIFPAIEKKEDLDPIVYANGELISGTAFNIVNKIVALIDAAPEQLCKKIEEAMKGRLETIRIEAFKGIKGKSYIDEEKAKVQVVDLIEFYWAAHPVKDDWSNYAQARDGAEALLAARKNLRDFVQPSWSDYIPKSSLDGFRESVIQESAYDKLNKDALRKQLGVREGERLCGVGLLKRHGNRHGDGSFFSTSHVAALPLLESLTSNKKKAVDNYERALTNLLIIGDEREQHEVFGYVPQRAQKDPHPVFGRNDGHLLFEERLREFFTDEGDLKEAEIALRDFLKDAFDNKKPKPYYALLHADGDRMGEAIDAQDTKDKHKAISKCLSEFAATVRKIVEEEHRGSLVYAGGDDVLAFLPLHEALFCARKLADEFRSVLTAFKKDGLSPTLSVGLAIGHHLDPLQDTLELARQAEKAAKKQVKGKNALAIMVSKRSGADWLVKGSWDKQEGSEALDHRMNRLIYLFLANELPHGIGYELRDTALRLRDLNVALRTEALRIIGRKRRKISEGKLTRAVFDKMAEYVNDKHLSIEDLAYQIITARPFAAAVKQTGMDAEGFAKKAKLEELKEMEN